MLAVKPKGSMKDFFISYTQADRGWAEWIAWQLEAAGYSTVLQAWDFWPGQNFVSAMHQAAQEAERTLAVLSPAYLASEFGEAEWAKAFARDPKGEKGLLVPVRIQKCALEGLLGQVVYIDLVYRDETAARETLLMGVSAKRAKPAIACPFPGTQQSGAPVFPGTPVTARRGVADSRSNAHPENQQEDRPQDSHPAAAPKEVHHHSLATWISGGLLLVFIVGVFIFAPQTPSEFKHRLLAFCAALLAGFFAYYLAGEIRMEIKALKFRTGNLSLRAAGGLATFALVLIWWLSPLAPIADQKTKAEPDAAGEISAIESSDTLDTGTDTDERSTISNGSKVLANWKGTDSFYPGVVLKTNNQKYYVAYDSSTEEWLDRKSIVLFETAKASELEAGTEVYALVRELQGEWISCTIKTIKDSQYLVSYQNNGVLHHKWVPLDSIVLRKH